MSGTGFGSTGSMQTDQVDELAFVNNGYSVTGNMTTDPTRLIGINEGIVSLDSNTEINHTQLVGINRGEVFGSGNINIDNSDFRVVNDGTIIVDGDVNINGLSRSETIHIKPSEVVHIGLSSPDAASQPSLVPDMRMPALTSTTTFDLSAPQAADLPVVMSNDQLLPQGPDFTTQFTTGPPMLADRAVSFDLEQQPINVLSQPYIVPSFTPAAPILEPGALPQVSQMPATDGSQGLPAQSPSPRPSVSRDLHQVIEQFVTTEARVNDLGRRTEVGQRKLSQAIDQALAAQRKLEQFRDQFDIDIAPLVERARQSQPQPAEHLELTSFSDGVPDSPAPSPAPTSQPDPARQQPPMSEPAMPQSQPMAQDQPAPSSEPARIREHMTWWARVREQFTPPGISDRHQQLVDTTLAYHLARADDFASEREDGASPTLTAFNLGLDIQSQRRGIAYLQGLNKYSEESGVSLDRGWSGLWTRTRFAFSPTRQQEVRARIAEETRPEREREIVQLTENLSRTAGLDDATFALMNGFLKPDQDFSDLSQEQRQAISQLRALEVKHGQQELARLQKIDSGKLGWMPSFISATRVR